MTNHTLLTLFLHSLLYGKHPKAWVTASGIEGAEQIDVPLEKGRYTVRLYFAESDKRAVRGDRIFDVIINGKKVLSKFDPSKHAVACVQEVAEQMNLENVKATVSAGEDLPGHQKFDLIITFDCLHDMTHPQEVMAVIRQRIEDDGTWFIKDIRSKADFEDNLRNPMLAMMYGFSLMSCMSSAMSTADGAGLGTLGFNPEVAETMCRKAGFTRFQMHDFKDPGNLYYEVRP